MDDPELQVQPQETINNLRAILGEIAEELQQTGQPYVDLGTFQSSSRKSFAELLWRLSGEERLSEDAKSRIGARSLLARVGRPDVVEGWPVDFCHRSMREYFVSVRLCQAVEQGEDAGGKFLREVPLNHEILDFAAARWRKGNPGIVESLLALLRGAVAGRNPGRLGGHALTLIHRIGLKLPQDFDWTGKIYDGADLEEANLAGMNFSSSSFKNANLANANFEGADFRQCDFTGVRIEETAHVVAIAVEPSGNFLIVGYADNLLREWATRSRRKIDSKIVGNIEIEPSSSVGIHEAGQMWMRIGREWLFWDRGEDHAWGISSRFMIKESIIEARPQGRLMTLIEENPDGSRLISIIDLSARVKLKTASVVAARHYRSLGMDAIAYSDPSAGVLIQVLDSEKQQGAPRLLPCKDVSCIDTLDMANGEYLVVVGTDDGRVQVWELGVRTQEWSQGKVFDVVAHDGPVTSVVFESAKRVISGGFDRSIALIGWNETDVGTIERRLMLRLRCKGMKIEGIRTEKERVMLAKLTEEADTQPPA